MAEVQPPHVKHIKAGEAGVVNFWNKRMCAEAGVTPSTSLTGVEGRLWVESDSPGRGGGKKLLCLNTPKTMLVRISLTSQNK